MNIGAHFLRIHIFHRDENISYGYITGLDNWVYGERRQGWWSGHLTKPSVCLNLSYVYVTCSLISIHNK